MLSLVNKLVFSSNTFICIFAFILLPLSLVFKSKILYKKDCNSKFLSKPVTDSMKGFSIVIIVLHHISQQMQFPGYMKIYNYFGYLGVSMFLFFSGYGLMVSRLKKENYFRGFFSKRLSKVYKPFIIVNIVTIIFLTYFENAVFSKKQILLYALGLNLIDNTQWFVVAIIIFYIGFYVCFKFFDLKIAPHILLCLTIFFFVILYKLQPDKGYWYDVCFCFNIGIYMAIFYSSIVKFLRKNYIITFITVSTLFCSFFYLSNFTVSKHALTYTVISSIFFVLFIILFLFKVNINSKVFLFIGSVSYEMYLTHMKILVVYFNHVKLPGSYTVVVYLILVIAVSYIFKKIISLTNFNIIRHLTYSPSEL